MLWAGCTARTTPSCSDLCDDVHLNLGGVAKLHRRFLYMLRRTLGVELGVSVFV
jgi:hypothetical protein